MKLKLFLCALVFCALTKAQTNTELKDFINKNTYAIRTIQKNMIRDNNSISSATFKEILKNQSAAVKLNDNDKKASMYFAYLVRTACLDYLKKYSQNNAIYFEITESEKAFDRSSSESSKVLSSSEIRTIDNMDAMSSQSLNNLTLTIQ